MRVVLTVVSEDGLDLGSRASCEFDEKGGTIGRNSHCHWNLPDPTNTISARHAMVSHNGRGFLISDMSTNGVFLNTVDAPIGRGSDAMLRDGDTLYLGHYVVAVEVREEPTGKAIGPAPLSGSRSGDFGPTPSSSDADPGFARSVPDRSRPAAPIADVPPLDLRAPGRTPLPNLDALFGADPRPAPAPSRSAEPPGPTSAEPPPRPPGNGAPFPARPLIPDDFLSDLLGSAPPASAPPFLNTPPRSASPQSAFLPPLPPEPLPQPSARFSEPRTPEPPKPRAAPGRSIYDDVVTLRQPGSDGAAGRGVLDPVAALRRRGSAGPPRSGDITAEPLPETPLDAPAKNAAAASESRAGAMPLPGRRGAGAAGPIDAVPPRSGSGAASFWGALGIDPPQDQAQETALFAQLGGALRAALNGIVPVLAARRSLKDAMRMDQTQLQGQDNNPLKFLPSGDAVLQALAASKLGGFVPLTDAVAQGFADIQAHEVAAVVSLGAVARNVIERLDPAILEGQGGSGRKFGRGADKAKLWDQYVAAHAALADKSDETTRKVVNEEFARAYAEQVRAAKQGSR